MKFPLKTILVEDEPLALKRLQRLLKQYPEVIHIIGEATNGAEGFELIERLHPDLIFLDIEMPMMNGFEMLHKINYQPRIIFTTAFEEYAIKAFEENSIDYLLKPIEQGRLEKTIEKLKNINPATEKSPIQIEKLLENYPVKKELKSFPVKVGDKYILLKPDEIAFFEAREKYVFIVTETNKEYITDFTLTSLEEKLPDPFLRVHRAFIINREKIKEVHKGFSGTFTLTMSDHQQTRIHTGRSYADSIKGIVEL